MVQKKKCPICNKPYRDYITHIWTHKAKTVKWLAARRKSKPKTSKKGSSKAGYCPSCGKKL